MWEERGLSRDWAKEERAYSVSPERGTHDPLPPPMPCRNVGQYSQIFPFFKEARERNFM